MVLLPLTLKLLPGLLAFFTFKLYIYFQFNDFNLIILYR